MMTNVEERGKVRKKTTWEKLKAVGLYKATSCDFVVFVLSIAKCKHGVESWI